MAPPRIGCLTAWYPVLLAGARGYRWMESDVHSRPPGLCHAQRPPSPSAALGTSGEPLVKAGEGARQGCRDSSNAGQARPRLGVQGQACPLSLRWPGQGPQRSAGGPLSWVQRAQANHLPQTSTPLPPPERQALWPQMLAFFLVCSSLSLFPSVQLTSPAC